MLIAAGSDLYSSHFTYQVNESLNTASHVRCNGLLGGSFSP